MSPHPLVRTRPVAAAPHTTCPLAPPGGSRLPSIASRGHGQPGSLAPHDLPRFAEGGLPRSALRGAPPPSLLVVGGP